jgi:ribosomal silencing factor RsfS
MVLGKAVDLVVAGSAAVLGAEGMVGGVEAPDLAVAAMVEGNQAAASAAAMVEAGRTAAMAVAEAAMAVERVAAAWAARVETEVALEVVEREVEEEAGPTSWVVVDGGAVVVVDFGAEMVEREAAARGAVPVASEEGEETRRHSRPGCTTVARAVCRGAFAPDPHRSCKRTHAPRRATCSS